MFPFCNSSSSFLANASLMKCHFAPLMSFESPSSSKKPVIASHEGRLLMLFTPLTLLVSCCSFLHLRSYYLRYGVSLKGLFVPNIDIKYQPAISKKKQHIDQVRLPNMHGACGSHSEQQVALLLLLPIILCLVNIISCRVFWSPK